MTSPPPTKPAISLSPSLPLSRATGPDRRRCCRLAVNPSPQPLFVKTLMGKTITLRYHQEHLGQDRGAMDDIKAMIGVESSDVPLSVIRNRISPIEL